MFTRFQARQPQTFLSHRLFLMLQQWLAQVIKYMHIALLMVQATLSLITYITSRVVLPRNLSPSTEFKPEGITIPAAIGVDPLTENVFIAAYQTTTSEYGTYADWATNGFVNVFSPSFQKIATFDCGVGPTRFAFNLGSETIIY